MATVTRTYPTGTLTDYKIGPLQEELCAYDLGAVLQSITRTEGDPDDTYDFHFDVAPNEVNLDAAIAAYPAYPAGVPDQWTIANNSYSNIYETDLAEGECIGAKIDLLVAFVTDSLDEEMISLVVSAHREVGGSAVVSNPATTSAGNIPGLRIETETSGNRIIIKFKMRRAGTLRVISKTVDVMRGRI